MYRTQHNDGREGEVWTIRRWEREGNKEGVEVKRMKEEREGTEGERKITFCRVSERKREEGRAKERERELVRRKRMEESEGGR